MEEAIILQNKNFNFQDTRCFLPQNSYNGTEYTQQLFLMSQLSNRHLYYCPFYNSYYMYPSYYNPYSHRYNDRRECRSEITSSFDNDYSAGYFEDYDGEYTWDFE